MNNLKEVHHSQELETKKNGSEPISDFREKIMSLESVMFSMPQIDIPIQHYFAPGIYLRQMTMPKDSVVTGKIHKTEHLCILAKGSITVVSENGRILHTAPAVIHSLPGTKRALHAHEDSVWINVHHNPSNETNLEKIDDLFVVDTFDQFLGFMEKKQLEGGK